MIEGDLDLTTKTGNNTGEIQGRSLTLQSKESFINSKILRGTQSVSFRGDGVVQNKNKAQIFSSGPISIKNKKLENGGHVQANGDVRVAEGAFVNTVGATLVSTGNLSVAQKGSLSNKGTVQTEGNVHVSDSSSLSNAAGATVTLSGDLSVTQKGVLSNQGKLSARTVTYHPDTFTNGGEMRAESNISFPNCITFKNDSKRLVVSETGQITLPKVLSFNNAGQISSQEDFSLLGPTSFMNTGTVVTAKKLTITSPQSFDNNGKLQGKGGATLTSSQTITNRGEILSEENVSLKGKEIHNHAGINGEKGVSLNGVEKVSNAGGTGINSKDGKVWIITQSLQNSGPIKGNSVTLDTQNSPTMDNVEAVKSLEICSPKVGLSLGGKSRTFGHDVSIIGPLRDLPPKGGSLQVKGNFTWENTGVGIGDFINEFNIRIDGILTVNLRGAWINQGRIEVLGGTNATLPRFENRGFYYGGGNSSFVCDSHFDNYGELRFVDGVSIHAQKGSITNHPKSEILQTDEKSLVSFIAKTRIENIAGTVNIRGRLESNSAQFINRILPPKIEEKAHDFKFSQSTRVSRQRVTFSTPQENLSALFYVGSAHIKTKLGQNIGGLISSREKIHFEGSTFQNFSQAYLCEGTAFVRRKKHRYDYIPYEVPFGSDVAKFYSQGDMIIEINKTQYTGEALLSFAPRSPKLPDIKNMDRKERAWNAALWSAVIPGIVPMNKVTHIKGNWVEKGVQIRKRSSGTLKSFGFKKKRAAVPAPEPLLKNTGDIKAYGAIKITAPAIHIPQFSAIEARGVVIPAIISLDMYLSNAQQSGHGFWILDTAKQTEFLNVPSIPIELISEESIAAQLSPANLKSKKAAEKETQEFKEWIIKRYDPHPKGKKLSRRGRDTGQSSELNGILAALAALQEFWEPDVEELGEITPTSLTLAPPRIAVLNDPRLRGGERMRFHPYLLADLVSKSLLDNIGFASLSRHIFSPILLSRVLEEQGYLNAVRIHGRPALPAPQDWERLSAQQRMARQLREVIFSHELEKFDTPAIVYQLMNEHGELVLSALITLPKKMRELFESAVGRMVAHYYGFNSTQGDTTVEAPIVARDGVFIDAANNATTSKVLARKAITVQAKGNYHNKGDVAAQKGDLTVTVKGTLHNQGTLEGEKVTAEAEKMIFAPLVKRERTSHGYRDTVSQPSAVRATSGDVNLKAKKDVTFKNADMSAARNLSVTAGGTVSLGSQALESEQTTRKKKICTTEHKKSHLSASKGKISIKAPHIKRGGVETHSKHGTTYDAQTTIVDEKLHDQHDETEKKKKGNSITGKKKTTKQSSKSTPVLNIDTSEGPVHFKAERSVELVAPEGKGSVIIFQTPQVVLETAKTATSSSTHKQGSNVVCQSKSGHGKSGITHTMAKFSGPVALVDVKEFDAEIPSASPQKVSQKGKHKAQSRSKKLSAKDFGQAIAKTQKDPSTAWIKHVLNHPNVRLSVAVDEFDEWKYSSHRLSLGGAALISLAVILATGGAATGITESVTTLLGGGVGASMAGTSASAAFQTLVTQAGISLANNQGNIRKTLKDLGSKSSIRALVTAAGTAGLTYGLCKALGVSQTGTSVGAHLQRSAIQTGVSTGFNIITQDQSLGDALLQGLINIGANTAGGLGANTIGDIYIAGDIDALTHKALHGLLGALIGAAANREDPGKGALGGAIGAVGAEVVAENLPDSMEARTRADAGRAAGTVVAVAAGQDGNAALLAGTNAVENNFAAPHYSPDPEAAQREMEEERRVAQDIAEVAGTKAPGFSEANEAAHSGVEALFDFYDNVPFIEYAPPPIQIMRHMRAPVHMGVDFVLPDTVGEVVLLAAGGVAGKVAKAPAAGEKLAGVAVKGARKLISEIAPYIAKAPAKAPAPGARNLSALDLAEKAPPKKAVTFKSSVEPAAKPAVKPTPTGDVAPKSILKPTSVQKPTSSTKKPATSYGKTPSRPTCSSSSRSPQAPSTAPPASSSSGPVKATKSSPPVGSTRPSESKVKRLPAPRGEPNAGGRIRSFVTRKDEVYYRVYSDVPKGKFLTKVPPKSKSVAKEGLALPPSNKATYIQEVHVPAGTRLQRSRALPVSSWDKRGSMEQFFLIDEIPPTNFKEGKVFQ